MTFTQGVELLERVRFMLQESHQLGGRAVQSLAGLCCFSAAGEQNIERLREQRGEIGVLRIDDDPAGAAA